MIITTDDIIDLSPQTGLMSLNSLFPYMPLGTLAANCIAGYLIEIAVAIFVLIPALVLWRLFIITGFLGGLSMFSSFSAKVVLLMQEGRFMWAGIIILTHVCASLTILVVMTGLFFLII